MSVSVSFEKKEMRVLALALTVRSEIIENLLLESKSVSVSVSFEKKEMRVLALALTLTLF